MNPARRDAPITVALLGPFGFGNLGDAAIQDAVITQLRGRRPDVMIVGISLNPADTLQRHGIQTYAYDTRAYLSPALSQSTLTSRAKSKRAQLWPHVRQALEWRFARWKRIANEIKHSAYVFSVLGKIDVLLFSGGGQLDEFWGGPSEHPFTIFKWALLARLRRRPVAFLSVGVGSITHPRSAKLLRIALAMATYRSYRDEGSKRLVHGTIGFLGDDPVIPDMAFALPPVRVASATERMPGRELTIAIGPIPYFDPRIWPAKHPARYQRYVEMLGELCARLIGDGHALKFIVGEVTHDPPVIRDVVEAITKRLGDLIPKARYAVPPISSLKDLMAAIAACDVVVSSRFHGVLLGLLHEKPVLALSYERKIPQLMADLGVGRFCIDLDSADAEAVHNLAKELVADRSAVRSHLRDELPKIRAQVFAQFDRVATCLLPPVRS